VLAGCPSDILQTGCNTTCYNQLAVTTITTLKMLLSCCFRQPHNKKQKKENNSKKNLENVNEDTTSPSVSLLSTQEHSIKTVHSATLRSNKEKHPPTRKEKRLLKQKSQESLQHRDFVVKTSLQHNSQHSPSVQYDSQHSQSPSTISHHQNKNENPTSDNLHIISTLHGKKDVNSKTAPTPFPESDDQRRLLNDKPVHLSASNLLEAFLVSTNPFLSRSESSIHEVDGRSLGSASVTHSQHSIASTNQNTKKDHKDKIDTIKRSTGFHNAEILEEQLKEEENQNTKKIKQLKEEYDLIVQNLKDEHKQELEKVIESYKSQLNDEMFTYEKEKKKAILKAESEANELKYKLNQQMLLERSKLIAEQEENFNNLREGLSMKEYHMNQSLKQIEEREQAWQEEKADILVEVQRLKAEATKMVKILAMEYEEEDLNEDKKRSLSQEVYSLQLVVEMRTGEVRNLREQLARATQDLEQERHVQEKLRTALTRIEDLEEQLRIKAKLEKQLSVEKNELEMTVTNSNKAVERMSQNVEELQWRIKNNFELPVEIVTAQNRQDKHISTFNMKSVTKSGTYPQIQTTHNQAYTCNGNKKSDAKSIRRSFFSVSPEMLEATSTNDDIVDKIVEESVTSDFSPSSDGVTENELKQSTEYIHASDVEEIDGDSLDEGLGDISSDCETVESPIQKFNNSDNNNNQTEQSIIFSAKSPSKIDPDDIKPPCVRKIPEKERRPSRMSFETSF